MIYLEQFSNWSGGGQVVARNIAFARQSNRELFDEGARGMSIVARNVTLELDVLRSPYVFMPQNAWPWSSYSGEPGEKLRYRGLRLSSAVLLRRASAVVRLSPAIPESANPAVPSIVLPNVLDEDFEVSLGESLGYDVSWAEDSFVLIGSLHSYRNVALVIRAFNDYRADGGRRRLEICGPAGNSKTLKKLIRSASKSNGVNLRCRSLARAECLAAFRSAHLCVFPSLVEASPISLLEAAAMGASIVASQIPGHTSILPSGSGALFFEPESQSELTQAFQAADNSRAGRVPESIASPRSRVEARQLWAKRLSAFLQDAIAKEIIR